MQKTVIAISLAAIVGIAYKLYTADGADVRYESFAAKTTATPAAGAPVPAPSPAESTPSASDDSIIWLDTVVVVAPRLVEPTIEAAPDRKDTPDRSDVAGHIGDAVDRVVPIRVVSDPDYDRATPGEVAKARGKMSPPLRELAANGGYEMVDVIVSLRTRPDLFEREVLADAGGVVMRRYESLNMRAIRIPVAALDDIAAEYNVKSLSLDSQLTATPVAANQT